MVNGISGGVSARVKSALADGYADNHTDDNNKGVAGSYVSFQETVATFLTSDMKLTVFARISSRPSELFIISSSSL